MKVFVSGATGLIGRAVAGALVARGDTVTALVRSPERAQLPAEVERVQGDVTAAGPWQARVDGQDAVVHLAGEPVDARWTEARKASILGSRVEGTRRVVEAIAAAARKPGVLVSASGQGYYGTRDDDQEVDESAPAGNDFLARVCVAWEAEARKAPARVALLRTGIVLSREGGALRRMETPFRLFAGGPLGSGRQWMSWIHIADEVGLTRFALDDARVEGPLNLVAPGPVRNADFARALGRAMSRPALAPAPAFAIRLVLGEMAQVVLRGARVVPRRALELGYRFRFPELDGALADLYRRP